MKLNKVFVFPVFISLAVHLAALQEVDKAYFTIPGSGRPKASLPKLYYAAPAVRHELVMERVSVSMPVPKVEEPKGASLSKAGQSPRQPALAAARTAELARGKEHVKTADLLKSAFEGLKLGERETQEVMLGYYLLLSRQIERYACYPAAAAQTSAQGRAELVFALTNDGIVKSVKIRKSAGSKLLDEAAVSAVRSAAPFPRFPSQIKERELKLKVAVCFQLER